MTKILLIDDDILEEEALKRVVRKFDTKQNASVQHVFKCSQAIDHLLLGSFDLVLLDNLLAASISGKFSVPIIKQYTGNCPLVMISNNVEIDYLERPEILGVDAVIAKEDLNIFMLNFFKLRQNNPNHPVNSNRPSFNAA